MSVSVSPCHLSGSGRIALASSSSRSTLIDSSPLRVVITVPCDADPVAEVERLDVVERRRRRPPPSRRTAGSRRCGRASWRTRACRCRASASRARRRRPRRRSRCPARATPSGRGPRASVCERSKRYGYGSVPAPRSSSTCASRRARSAARPLPRRRLRRRSGRLGARRRRLDCRPHGSSVGSLVHDGSTVAAALRVAAMASSLQSRAVVVAPARPLATPGGRARRSPRSSARVAVRGRRRAAVDRRSGDGRRRRPTAVDRCSATSSPSTTSASSTPRSSTARSPRHADAGGVGTAAPGRHDRHDAHHPRRRRSCTGAARLPIADGGHRAARRRRSRP